MGRATKIDRTRRALLRPFEAAVLQTCAERELSLGPGPVLVALSGGPDSTALVAALAALRDRAFAGLIVACHVDHRLRPGSAADADACELLCRSLSVPLRRVSVEVRNGNVQAAARRARYAVLRKVADEVGAVAIATGHTRSDQAETVVLRLLRGAGARGLAGIPPRRGRIVRPLIDRSRSEILDYLRERGLGWCEDPTNATPRYDRNRVRREVLPVLEALQPGAEAALARAADLLRDDDRALEALARARVPSGTAELTREDVAGAPRAVQTRLVRRIWRDSTGSRRGLDARHVAALLRLLARRTPGRISLPGGRVGSVKRGVLRISDCDGGRGLL